MKPEILPILKCPRCSAALHLASFEEDRREVRRGQLTCAGREPHQYDIEDGIIRFTAGFDHDAVRKELEYENSTYSGSERLTDPKIIGQFPDTLPELWPHTCHFGPDFTALMDRMDLRPGAWVLDVGTGPCWSTRLLAQRGCRAIAIDVNEANFYGLKTSDILFEAHGVYFERILESMTHMPFNDGSIDRITFNASFHHTPDMDQTLRECFRILKPGGVIGMVNEEFASVRKRFFGAENVSDTGSHHTIFYRDLERSFQRAGFSFEYQVANHVRQELAGRLSRTLGSALVKFMETFPFTLKQLNSAVVLLSKPPARATTHRSNAGPRTAEKPARPVAISDEQTVS